MRRGTLIRAMALAALAAGLAVPAAAMADRPVVLLLHGGGGLSGDVSDSEPIVAIARDQGFRPVPVRYPPRHPVLANLHSQRIARHLKTNGHSAFAYGESVGGTIAEALAAQCLVDAAAANSAPPDLLRWSESGRPSVVSRQRLRPYSPFHLRQCSPVLAMHSRADGLVDFRFALEYAERYRPVTLRRLSGGHVGNERTRRNRARAGVQWLALQASRFHPATTGVSATLR